MCCCLYFDCVELTTVFSLYHTPEGAVAKQTSYAVVSHVLAHFELVVAALCGRRGELRSPFVMGFGFRLRAGIASAWRIRQFDAACRAKYMVFLEEECLVWTSSS